MLSSLNIYILDFREFSTISGVPGGLKITEYPLIIGVADNRSADNRNR